MVAQDKLTKVLFKHYETVRDSHPLPRRRDESKNHSVIVHRREQARSEIENIVTTTARSFRFASEEDNQADPWPIWPPHSEWVSGKRGFPAQAGHSG